MILLSALRAWQAKLLQTAARASTALASSLRHDQRQPSSPFITVSLPPAAAIHPFDLVHGVDTSGLVPGSRLLSGHRNDTWNTAYYAIAPSIFHAVLDRLAPAIDHRWDLFSFIDLGSGKGRALMLAANKPFAHVLGIELNPELFRISEENLRHFRASLESSESQPCPPIEVRHGDATTLQYPPTPLVVFLYHPFLAPVLRRCLFQLRRSLRDSPREAWVLYVNAESEHVFRHFPEFHREWEQVFAMDARDVLADRTDSTEERVVAFHVTPPFA